MGIVAKQTISNIGIIFFGAFLGAINILLLYPIVLEDDQIGLTRLLITFMVLFSQLFSLGGSSMLIKFIPFFKVNKADYKGSATFIFSIGIVGFVVSILAVLFGKPVFVHFYGENSSLFIGYLFYLIPLLFFQILINYFTALLQAVYRSVFPLFVNEVFIRILQSCFLGMFFYKFIDFELFMILFVAIYGFSSLILFSYLIYKKEIKLQLQGELAISDKKEIVKYGAANMITGLAGSLTNRIDLLMIGAMVGTTSILTENSNQGLKYITIYTIAAYMATMIEMPARALHNIITTFISKAWKENDLETIDALYKRSSITQMLSGLLIFVGIWVSIDNLLIITGKDYSTGKWVFLFLGIAKLIHLASGVNAKIINLSKYYIVSTYLMVSLVVITFISNLILIPIFEELPGRSGIEGAAIATSISLLILNFVSFLFLWSKYKLQPYNYKLILLTLIGILIIFINSFLPEFQNIFIDIILRSMLVIIIFTPLVYFLKISEDFNRLLKKCLAIINIKL